MKSDLSLTVGIEVSNFSESKIATGIQHVISHLYSNLEQYWLSRNIRMVPTICQTDTKKNAHTLTMPNQNGARFRTASFTAPEECDIIVLPDIDNGVDFQRLRKLSSTQNVPIVVIVHDILPLLIPDHFPDGGKRNFRIWLQQTLSVANHVVVTTEKVKSDIKNLGWKITENIHVVGLGSRVDMQEPNTMANKRIAVLYVSTIEPRKGHDLLLQVLNLLISWGHDVTMTFIGHQGWSVERLCDEIRGHPEFGSRLRWHSGASDEVVKNCALMANIGVMPSQGEGFGMFLEEGLSMGLKMIASDIPEFRERAQPNLYFSSRNAAAFAETIVRVHKISWINCPPPRSMRDFAYDFSKIVEAVMQKSDFAPSRNS